MSLYNTVVLSFSWNEIDEPDAGNSYLPRDCKPLRQVNAWLKRRGYEPLKDMGGGSLGMNVCLFGGCYDDLMSDEFCAAVQRAKWREIADVRVLYWFEEDVTFTMTTFPLATPKGRPRKPA